MTMVQVDPGSLSATVDAINEAMFFGREVPIGERRKAADLIASRHGLPGAYANSFALFAAEKAQGFRLFTGERTRANGGGPIIGQEACRVLRWLNVPAGKGSLAAATQSLASCVGPVVPPGEPKPNDGRRHRFWDFRGSTYCCGPCSVGFWRHLTAGGYDDRTRRETRAVACLKTHRNGDGDWRSFPFWYTLSALIEMDASGVIDELRYAADRCEKSLKRPVREDAWSVRRHEIARCVLSRA